MENFDEQFLREMGIKPITSPKRKRRGATQPPPPDVISQADVIEVDILRRRARAKTREWNQARRRILERLLRGAEVEPGAWTVDLDVRIR